MLLNSLCVPKGEIMSKTVCEWEGEPARIVWSFELKENNILKITAVYYEDEFDKNNTKTLIKTEYPYDDFLLMVLIEIDALIKETDLLVTEKSGMILIFL